MVQNQMPILTLSSGSCCMCMRAHWPIVRLQCPCIVEPLVACCQDVLYKHLDLPCIRLSARLAAVARAVWLDRNGQQCSWLFIFKCLHLACIPSASCAPWLILEHTGTHVPTCTRSRARLQRLWSTCMHGDACRAATTTTCPSKPQGHLSKAPSTHS